MPVAVGLIAHATEQSGLAGGAMKRGIGRIVGEMDSEGENSRVAENKTTEDRLGKLTEAIILDSDLILYLDWKKSTSQKSEKPKLKTHVQLVNLVASVSTVSRTALVGVVELVPAPVAVFRPLLCEATNSSVPIACRFAWANSCFAGNPSFTDGPTCQIWFTFAKLSGIFTEAKITKLPLESESALKSHVSTASFDVLNITVRGDAIFLHNHYAIVFHRYQSLSPCHSGTIEVDGPPHPAIRFGRRALKAIESEELEAL
ncbi:hypothetical protein GH714_027147 [Hevea brasiliensis]|uniref:Uncharacterized protein n=1 Tax=Hevea brasiliensis TaxID=3981 RepID=A0A6A6K981_HEVBR|nr:hypothetical protein GH714_027147 [Hevea brasiliensis]